MPLLSSYFGTSSNTSQLDRWTYGSLSSSVAGISSKATRRWFGGSRMRNRSSKIGNWWSDPASSPGTPTIATSRSPFRSEEHTSELQSLMRISYAVYCLKKKNQQNAEQHFTTQNTTTEKK